MYFKKEHKIRNYTIATSPAYFPPEDKDAESAMYSRFALQGILIFSYCTALFKKDIHRFIL